MSLTFSSTGSIQGDISITTVTDEMYNISEYLDFGFYDRIWYTNNTGLGPSLAGRWLGISQNIGRLMTYNVLTQKRTVVSRGTIQRVTELEMQLRETNDTFKELDVQVLTELK